MAFHFTDEFYAIKFTKHITKHLCNNQDHFKIETPQCKAGIRSDIKSFSKSKYAGISGKANNGGKDRFLSYAIE